MAVILTKDKVTYADSAPADEPSYTCNIQQPVEYIASTGRQIEESEQANDTREKDSVMWRAKAVGVRQESRRMSIPSQGDHNPTT
ncbi:hypothetical protein RRF57_000048 [Xylaria bambusicola]|uniref:Uncharacterized protein n=1 Tax=Xylaria bambusicola TaxID=326684 RepID=A0AAN7UA29_9PEZI